MGAVVRCSRPILTALGLLVLTGQIVLWLPVHVRTTLQRDVTIYRAGALRLRDTGDAYAPCVRESPGATPWCVMYAPPFVALTRPLAALSEQGARAVVYGTLIVAFWVFCAGLVRIAAGRVRPWLVAMVGIAVFFLPGGARSMSFGNVDMVVWALVVWACAVPSLAAPLLTVGAAFKLSPGLALAVLLLRDRRLWRPTLLTAVPILVATLVVVGPRSFLSWVSLGLPGLWHGTVNEANASLTMQLTSSAPLRVAVGVAAVVAAAWATRRLPPALQATIVMVTGTICSPICWWHHWPLALVPLALVVREKLRGNSTMFCPIPRPGSLSRDELG